MTPRRPAERRRRQPAVEEVEGVGARLIAIFCLGLVLSSPLVIDIFDRGPGVRLLGVPLLYLYLFAAWAVLIALLAWVLERPSAGGSDGSLERPRNAEDPNGASR